jgi:hypothetical protein
MTTNSLQELTVILAEKTRVLEAVREKLAEGQRCIIEVRPEVLAEKTGEAEEGFRTLDSLNIRFRKLLPKAAHELGLPENSALSVLISAADPDSGIQLQALQERCFSVAGAIASLLSMNELLIKNSLDIVNRTLKLFSTILGGAETYGEAGRISSGKAAAGIICKEI